MNLEREIIQWLQNDNARLSQQLTKSIVYKKEYSGAGFFYHFKFHDISKIIPLGKEIRTIEGPLIVSKSLDHDAGSIVFCRDGYVDFLEVFSYNGIFPENLREFTLKPSPVRKFSS